MDRLTAREQCTGCSACVNVCPRHCVCMNANDEGFYYPTIDNEQCVHCGLCAKHCPVNRTNIPKEFTEKKAINVFAFRNADDVKRLSSTSGGFFSALADFVLSQGGVVCAAGFDEIMNVTHRFAMSASEMDSLRGSKYVQSRLERQFVEIHERLKCGQTLLFVGTPCQIAGLQAFLDLNPTNQSSLFTVQLKCYGVSSPGLFKKYIAFIEQKYQKKVSWINFRDKQFGYAASTVNVHFSDGSSSANNYPVKTNSKTFFSGLNMRRSCYDCKFRSVGDSIADFVIGDLHDVGKYAPDFNDDLGVTLVYALTDRARAFMTRAGEQVIGLPDYREEPERNPAMPAKRHEFMKDSVTMDWYALAQRYCPNSPWDDLATKIKPLLLKNTATRQVYKLIKKVNKLKYQLRTRKT